MDKRFTEALYNVKELKKRYAAIGMEGILGLGIIDNLIKESEEVLKEYETVKAKMQALLNKLEDAE